MSDYVSFAKNIRKKLHETPEPSMHERNTKKILLDTLRSETDLAVIDCGKWFYVRWNGREEKSESGFPEHTGSAANAIAFRADYDAVTGADGVCRHLCGHDGHAAVLAAFGKWISDHKPACNILLLFQPGEESGEGALVCRDLFHREKVKEIYGFHNIPGYGEGKILLKEGTFACASTGLEIHFQGAPSHAAYPEYGKNPALAVAELIVKSEDYLIHNHNKGILLSTVIGIDLGSSSYGVSASAGTLRLTVRAEYQDEFDAFLNFIKTNIDAISIKYDLHSDYREVERFPSTENDSQSVRKLRELMETIGVASDHSPGHFNDYSFYSESSYKLTYEMMEEPRRWSEDFGWYLQEIPGAFVGIGAGCDWAQLHTESYEFNDKIIPAALEFYQRIAIAESI